VSRCGASGKFSSGRVYGAGMPSRTVPFRAGDYRSAEEAWRDAANWLANFDDTAKIVAKNGVIELLTQQDGVITCNQVAVIARTVANALQSETYGETLS
jgi:hypothetical protein